MNRACSEPIRTSQASASDIPAPAATPFTAAIIGLSIAPNASACAPTQPNSSIRSFCDSRGASPGRAVRSAPEQNPRPAPVTITTRTSSSSRSAAAACTISSCSGRDRAFNFSGRSSVTVPMWSEISTRRCWYVISRSFAARAGYPPRAISGSRSASTSSWRKQPAAWSFTIPAACMNA